MRVQEYIRHDDKAASRLAPKGDGGCFDLYVAMELLAGVRKPAHKRDMAAYGTSDLRKPRQ
jgi:hypothetical protein